eukprot:TRINITY_DN30861_c0_g1_i1.p1 TRINITY_DN30861_c0_g1~~TRINITY_DN30861_c0_g1_i1.p1  ORF type:complete len:139 (-),score=26.77 TRINITY_DN30861_c0_g1_i1:120-536(-)
MSMTGIAVDDEVVQLYQELKLGHKIKFAVFKINDSFDTIIVEKSTDSNATYSDFLESLPENECRYAVYDFDYQLDEGKRNKLIFVLWTPDNSGIKSKLLYAATKDAIKKKLVGISTEIQATDDSEIEYDYVFSKITSI